MENNHRSVKRTREARPRKRVRRSKSSSSERSVEPTRLHSRSRKHSSKRKKAVKHANAVPAVQSGEWLIEQDFTQQEQVQPQGNSGNKQQQRQLEPPPREQHSSSASAPAGVAAVSESPQTSQPLHAELPSSQDLTGFSVPVPGVEPAGKDGGGTVAATPGAADGRQGVASHCVVGGAHAFILRISSFFGLAPLKFESRSNGFTVTISSAMCIYSYILVTVLVICTIFGLATEINVGVELSVRMSSRMSQVVSTCDVLVVVATAGAGVYGAPRRMRDMLKFMDSVASVDNSIGAQYSIINERKLSAVLLAILIFFTVLLTDDFCFYVLQAKKFDRQWDIVTNYIGFYLLWYVVMVLELQFAFTALSVRTRFRAVNDAIALTARHVAVPLEKLEQPTHINMFAIRVAPAEPRRSASNVSLLVDALPGAMSDHPIIIRKNANGEPRLIVPPCEAVRRLAALHGALCEVVQCIDRSYGLPLVVILLSTLLHLIVTPYFLIMEIIVSTNRIHFLVLQFLWCVTHMLRMFVVVEPCHYTITEGKRTEELVCQLMTYAPSGGTLPSRLELFSRQLMLRSVTYSPLGMCTLDRPLVASVIGAVTTYLVILIQFQRYDS